MNSIKSIPNYNDWEREQVNITDLFLDPENIRLESEDNLGQDSIINDLFANENAMQVLESIALNNWFPDQLPITIKTDNKYVVIEGNRRLAALKALLQPDIVPTKATAIKNVLKTTSYKPESIEVLIAPNRESINRLLASKHTQKTTEPWSTLRQAYFYKAQLDRGKTVEDLKKDYPKAQIVDFLRLINIHRIAKSIEYDSKEITKQVHNERKFPATTLERLYDDKNTQDFLGFNFKKDGELNIMIDQAEFKRGLKRIVQDIVNKNVNSRKLNQVPGRLEYISAISKELKINKTPVQNSSTSKDFQEIEVPVTNKTKKLIPKDIVCNLKSPSIEKMLKELQDINYSRFPNASHDLLRSFLECSLKAYFDELSIKIMPKKQNRFIFLEDVLNQFTEHIKSIKKLHQVALKIKANDKMTSYSKLALDATNHNPEIFITEKEVKDACDALLPILRYILKLEQPLNESTSK